MKPSGVIVPTVWPRRSISRIVLRNVTTTPLICGDQAWLTSGMRSRRAGRTAVAVFSASVSATGSVGWFMKSVPGRDRRTGRRCGARQRRGCNSRLVPPDNGKRPIVRLDERGQALHPIAGIAVQHAADVADLRVVDVPADHAVEPARARLACERFLEGGDVADRILDLEFEELRERPVGQAEAGAQRIEVLVQLER